MLLNDNKGDQIRSAQPIRINSSVWFAKERWGPKSKCAPGMLEYNTESKSFATVIPWCSRFGTKEKWLSTCKYKKHSIVVVDGITGELALFNTKTRDWTGDHIFHNDFGPHPTCITIGDYIHIFHGQSNPNGHYAIISLVKYLRFPNDDQTKRLLKEQHIYSKENCPLSQVAILQTNGLYESSAKAIIIGFVRQQSAVHIPAEIIEIISGFVVIDHELLIKFGGWNLNLQEPVDSFYIGTLKDQNPKEPIRWSLAPQYTLKQPLKGFGYIHYGPFIVMFGGLMEDGNVCDDIQILNLTTNCGWVQSSIKCPREGQYNAVLDDKQRIHLYGKWKCERSHFCLDVNIVLSSV